MSPSLPVPTTVEAEQLPKVGSQLHWKWSLRPICLERGLFYTAISQRDGQTATVSSPPRVCFGMRAVSATRLAITLLFQIILSSTVVSAFSFTFLNNPTQCSSLTVAVDGGTAPYRLNLIPAGPMPGGQAEIRVIVDEAFSEKTFKLNALKFPANSQFVAMVSDANGMSFSRICAVRGCIKALTSFYHRCWNRWNKLDSYRLRLEKLLVSPEKQHNSRILLLPEP